MVAVLCHGDADGLCSAALIKARYPDARIILTRPIALHNDLRKVVKEDLVFVCDIGINVAHEKAMKKRISELGKKLIYIDHHPGSPKGKWVQEGKATSEIAYQFAGADIDPDMRWIAVFGCIGDRFETKFVKDAYLDWDKQTLQFEATTLVLALEISRNRFKKIIVEELSNGKFPTEIRGISSKAQGAVSEEKNIRAYVRSNVEKSGKVGYVLNPPGRGFGGKAAIFARSFSMRPIGLCAREVNKSEIDISLRSEEISLSKAVQEAALKVGGSGGGHPKAAGATIPAKTLNTFIREINKRV